MSRKNTKGHKQTNLYIPTMTRNQLQKMYPELPFTTIVNNALREHVRNNYDSYLIRMKKEKQIEELERELED